MFVCDCVSCKCCVVYVVECVLFVNCDCCGLYVLWSVYVCLLRTVCCELCGYVL